MRFKVDENLSPQVMALFDRRANDLATVVEEGLGGASDEQVARISAREGRILLTLDRGFGDIRRYPPGTNPGIFVLRPSSDSLHDVADLVTSLLSTANVLDFANCTTVVEPDRIRVRR